MNAIGGEEVLMGMLHPKSIWVTSGGWDNVDVLFKLKSRTEKEYALGQSEEEVVTPLVMKYVNTYRDLPKAAYQIHWKFRDELRSKSGLMRGVEFLMKDMYSFHADQADFDRFYGIAKKKHISVSMSGWAWLRRRPRHPGVHSRRKYHTSSWCSPTPARTTFCIAIHANFA